MPTEPFPLLLFAIEVGLFLTGIGLVGRILGGKSQRSQWLGTNQLPPWPINFPEFVLLIVLLIMAGSMAQAALQTGLGSMIKAAGDRAGLEVLVYGSGFHGGVLLGWSLFPFLRRYWRADAGAPPPLSAAPSPPAPSRSWSRDLLVGAGLFTISLPLLGLLHKGWQSLLQQFGQEPTPQDLLAIFSETESPLVVAGMLFVACVLAPLSEELLFRAGLYRYTRQKLGRSGGLLISAGIFGLVHGNLAGFLPLAALGVLLALAYEATGSLRVCIIAHGLFNLNTIAIILSGLAPAA